MAIDLLDTDERLPTAAELPCSDDTPVDNENQNTLPNWLLAVLEEIWSDRQDWFFGVDMGIYDREAQKQGKTTVVTDGFLSVGVQGYKREGRAYPLPGQMIQQERQRSAAMEQALEQERLEKLRLLAQLQQLGLEREE